MPAAFTRLLMTLILVSLALLSPAFGQEAYIKAIAASKDVGPAIDAGTRKVLDAALQGGPLDASVEALLSANAEALYLLEKAASAPTVDLNPDKKGTLDRPVLQFARLRDLCALATVRGAARAAKGDKGGALRDLQTVLRVGRHLLSDAMLIYKMVGTMVLNQALPTLKAQQALPGLQEALAACTLPSPRVFADDEKKLFIEAVGMAAADPSAKRLGPMLVKHAPPLADRYYGLLARQAEGDKTADPTAAINALSQALEKEYGSTALGVILEKMEKRPDMTDDKKAEAVDSALLVMVFPSLNRPMAEYQKMLDALNALRSTRP